MPHKKEPLFKFSCANYNKELSSGPMVKRRAISVFFIALAIVLVVLIHFLRERPRMTRTFYTMGGIPLKITAYQIAPREFYKGLLEAKSLTKEFEDIFNRFLEDSEISKINSALGPEPQNISNELLELMMFSQKWYQKSGGAFDITAASLSVLWGNAEKKNTQPHRTDIATTLKSVGMNLLRINTEESTIATGTDGVELDFGGIAKGYLVDKIADTLQDMQIEKGLVELSGHIRCWGKKIFKIGIQDPISNKKGALMGTIKTAPAGVVTSGNYERFFEIEGKRYSHIINPKTGYPAEGLVSVTVISTDAVDADALATALSVMGRERGIKLLKDMSKTYAVFVEKIKGRHFKVWYSRELESNIVLYGDWNKDTQSF